jgi:CDP-diacylglycerol--glycerol-3-phosphate 3-phosphatidyltransferase
VRRLLPNLLTASRGLAGLVVAWVLVGPLPDRLGFWLFVVAVFTDLFDGWLARRLHATSAVGQWLDPLSDKLLAAACWLGLWWVGWAPGWLVGTILLRDVLVASGFAVAWSRGLRFAPNLAGRLMVSFEGVALAVLLFHGPWIAVDWPAVGVGLGVLTLLLSVGSALEYLAEGPVPRANPPGEGSAS